MKFPKLVIEEAKALRKHTTKEERSKLNFQTLDHEKTEQCIYGQMTGRCYSKRAKELIEKSCKKVYSTTDGSFTEIKLNGTPVGRFRRDEGKAYLFARNTEYYSPIEVFIAKKDGGANLKLISFIKGEIKSL